MNPEDDQRFMLGLLYGLLHSTAAAGSLTAETPVSIRMDRKAGQLLIRSPFSHKLYAIELKFVEEPEPPEWARGLIE